jgi:glycosyltransferase involved in cell wall biosynthesis
MISIVVATRNRPQLLAELLQAIQKQDLKPLEVIIVDSSDNFIDFDHRIYSFEIRHIKSNDPSISRQRNIGLKLVSSASKYLSVLDDDTIPDPTYLEKLTSFLENSRDTVGASGITEDTFPEKAGNKLTKFIKYLFFLDSSRSGTITRGAVNVGVRTSATSPIESAWLLGCSIYKINEIRNLLYDSSLDGYSLGEDVIFSYKASASGKLYILPEVRLLHRQSSQSTHYKSDYWFKWVTYRKTLVSIMPGKILKWIYYGWTNVGQVIMVLFTRRESTGLNRLLSILAITKGTLRG